MIKAEEYLSQQELAGLGLGACGRNVFISRRAVIAHPPSLHLGHSIRIDAFSSIIGRERVEIGDFTHVGSSVTISASAAVSIGSFCGLASGVRLFTADDDYSGAWLTGPTVPPESSNVAVAPVRLGRYCVVGANAVLLPGSELEEGAVIGALSLARGAYAGWTIYGGIPASPIKARTRELLGKLPAG